MNPGPVSYTHLRYQSDMMLVTVMILVVIVQLFPQIGMKLAKIGDRRSKEAQMPFVLFEI